MGQKLSNYLFGCLFFIIFGCSPKTSSDLPLEMEKRPNVLLIYVDDLNNRLGYYDDSIAITPNIDALANEGIAFMNSYCQQPLCNPSRTSMLTGKRPSSLGINTLNVHFRDKFPDIKTLPQTFKEAGYFTARVGKVFHQGVPDAIAQQSAGADDPKAWNQAFDVPSYELNNNGHYYNATPWNTHKVGAGGSVAWLRAEKGDNRHHDFNVSSKVIELMDEPKDKPFFLAAGLVRPHVPLVAPKRFFELYDSVEIPSPEYVINDREDMPKVAYDSWAANFNISEEDTKEAVRAYYACISFVDEQIGRLIAALKEKNLEENTIVVFVSDHGYQLGSHGLWFKNYLFKESVISPLIFKVPNTESKKVQEVVELLDVYPTLLDLAQIPSPNHLEGKSFRSLIENESSNWKDFAIVECKRKDRIGRAVYKQNWSLMNWGEGDFELYDLEKDPYQFTNLASTEQNKVEELNRLLNDFK